MRVQRSIMQNEEGHYILGITWNGNKFRPSDWVERIATAFGSFDEGQRLKYNPEVKPVIYKNQHCLFVASNLAANDGSAYRFIMDFANNNHLQVKNTGESDCAQLELKKVA